MSKNIVDEDFENVQQIELRKGHVFPLSKCFIPNLERFRFGEISFIINRKAVNDVEAKKNNCENNLLHEIHFIKLSTQESLDKIKYMLSKKQNIIYLNNIWLNLYIVDDLDNRNDVSFHIYINYPDDKYSLYIQGRIESLNKKESYLQTCTVLKRFLAINESDDLYKEILESVFCEEKE
jgi:hypothetical protein